eukprot:2555405-Prymnesium_polylepis.1
MNVGSSGAKLRAPMTWQSMSSSSSLGAAAGRPQRCHACHASAFRSPATSTCLPSACAAATA